LLSDEEGGNLYLINGNMTKLKDAGGFMKQPTETEPAEGPPEEEEDA
ncbi:phage portal protein, partial [Streptococcus anginosus]|nr:phage portal protein [Streptococcus anginosus]